MSRRPGIASDWYDLYSGDVYPKGFVTMRGIKMKPPKYYDGLFERTYPTDLARQKAARKREAKKHADNNTPARLRVREKVQEARAQLLIRGLD